MTADNIEELYQSYQSVTFGYDEPEMMWLTGATAKYLAEQGGHEPPTDDDGKPLKDNELYCLTSKGIFRVD